MVYMNRHAQPGFSMMELLAYTFIVGLLMVAAFVGIRTVQHRTAVNNTDQAMSMIKMAIDGYHARNDAYPPTLNELKTRYLKEIPKDGWGNPFKYKVTEGDKHPYELYSYGSEGPGGDASERISVWQK